MQAWQRKVGAVAARINKGITYIALAIFLAFAGSLQAAEPTSSLPWVEAKEERLPVLSSGQFVFRFTGAGGFYLGNAATAILVDPFLTNPGLWPVLSLQQLKTDAAMVDRFLPITEQISAVLVGHAHYDHALDIPYIFTKLSPNVRLYGSETLNNMLASEVPVAQRVNVEPHMAKDASGGGWLNVTPRLRVLPIESEHSPHVGRFIVANGKLQQAMQKLPADSLDWIAGTTLSYLVDFLDEGGRVSYRVFVQTSSSNPPKGMPPKAILDDGYPVNVAVLCAANFTNVKDYPEILLNSLQPKEVVIVHWEKFWEPWVLNQATPLPGLDLGAFVARIRAAVPHVDVKLPQRGAQFLLPLYQPAGGNPHG